MYVCGNAVSTILGFTMQHGVALVTLTCSNLPIAFCLLNLAGHLIVIALMMLTRFVPV